MEDFNSDNTKTDAALKENADNIAALEAGLTGKGNCRIIYGTYNGHGQYGSAHPTSLTFDGKPLAVFVMAQTNNSSTWAPFLPMIRGIPWASAHGPCTVTWSENGVSWYHDESASYQLSSGSHCYIALLAAEQ